jgi:hypothetical protein
LRFLKYVDSTERENDIFISILNSNKSFTRCCTGERKIK